MTYFITQYKIGGSILLFKSFENYLLNDKCQDKIN